jgi:hypothetical protein
MWGAGLLVSIVMGDDSADERRANPRFVCELRTYVLDAAGSMFSGISADLSRTGASVRLATSLEPGSRVQLHLRLMLGWTASDFLMLPARVVRCEPAGDAYQLGVELDALDEAQAGRLDLLVRVLEGELDAVLDDARR